MNEPSHRIANGQFELAVCAAKGRIVYYGPLGGPNVLWENPDAAGSPTPLPGWLNWGGDKVWLWPQADWPRWTGIEGPPGDPAPGSWHVQTAGSHVRMTSPLIEPYGVRLVREITLAGMGAQVTLVNRVEQLQPGRLALPVAPWTVTQLPAAPRILARLLPGAKSPGFEPFPPNPWTAVEVADGIATLSRPPGPWVKMGLDADLLAVGVGEWLFSVSVPAPDPSDLRCERCRQAQVFCDPDDSPFRPASLGPYVELEFTAPVKPLRVGESASLTTLWNLAPLRPGGATPAEIIARRP